MAPKLIPGVRSFVSSINELFYQLGRRFESTLSFARPSILSVMFPAAIRWCPTSDEELEKVENELLSALTRPFKSYFIDIGSGWGNENNRIRTLEMLTDDEMNTQAARNGNNLNKSNHTIIIDSSTSSDDTKTSPPTNELRQPLVLVHGFGSGIGTWILNLDTLATKINRKIYAFDLIGFGRSTRAPFDLDGDVEAQFVDSIERWREKQGIEKFVLLGHSFGGYLSANYALRHPQRVSHIILADPWGVQDRSDATNRPTFKFPIWVRMVNFAFRNMNPLAVLRVTGPYGPSLVHKFRGDLREKFRPKLQDDAHKFLNYIYHCNAQTATGEAAFKSLTLPYGWPKSPLIHRLLDMDESVNMSFIYGSRSWISKAPGEFLRDCMAPNRVTVDILQGSGHHVYADKYQEFNNIVEDIVNRLE